MKSEDFIGCKFVPKENSSVAQALRLTLPITIFNRHKFHHLFNDILLPSTAMAVSPAEFIFAYLLPITIGCCTMKADRACFVLSTGIIAYANIRIHTPYLKDTKLPWFMVSPADHFHHHRHFNTNYSAPLVHYDRILECFAQKTKGRKTS